MDTADSSEVYDLLLMSDATFSMDSYIRSLKQSLPQILSISALTSCFERVGLLAYRDYTSRVSTQNIVQWSGWQDFRRSNDEQPDLVSTAKSLVTMAGGDYPEAVKTALAKAYEVMRPEAKTLILLYTDAPPHQKRTPDDCSQNSAKEQSALCEASAYGGYGKHFVDWASAARTLRHGEKKAQVISVLDHNLNTGHYEYLSTMTNGITVYLQRHKPADISEVTVGVLLAWMGVRKPGTESAMLPAKLARYGDLDTALSVRDEDDATERKYFGGDSAMSRFRSVFNGMAVGNEAHFGQLSLSSEVLDKYLPKKATPLQDFSQRYKTDPSYRQLVGEHLHRIIDRDVTTISLNPVFGTLWRTVCNDRAYDSRQGLLDLFGRRIDGIHDAGEKARMKTWLEQSYDYTAEVLDIIGSVPEAERFPCVCLDPTLAFVSQINEASETDADDQPITSFRRDELLEIGRSCDWRILRRLGRILTRLSFIGSTDALPAHIAAVDNAQVPKIPLALADPKYKRQFWRILLHIVVPGTMLSARPAALLAALSIKLGFQPLAVAAEQEMINWRQRWNNIEVPETWNVNCLSLLLDADRAYRDKQIGDGKDDSNGLLLSADRLLFERLVDYKMLELNRNTSLTAQVGWTPEKSTMAIGPVRMCSRCSMPRSVSIMGPDNVCGLCMCEWASLELREKHLSTRVAKSDAETANAVWYECCVRTCRAQYVVYNVEAMNVRPKCHYCRMHGTATAEEKHLHAIAPVVECARCLSRMIWPSEYRQGIEVRNWLCVACTSGRKTIDDMETTANRLRDENGTAWLLRNDHDKIKDPFNGRSLFHLASTAAPLDDFCDRVDVLPSRDEAPTLHINGKPVHNASSVINQLHSWISRRRTESGTCSLCFNKYRKTELQPACGRSGCAQRICKSCLEGWFGLNKSGSIINTAALSCPFCRRAPTAKTLARYGMGIHAVGGLREAVEQSGEYIYAWCRDCGFAKQYMERVCAAGAPAELTGWRCDACRSAKDGSEVQRWKPCPSCATPTEKLSGCDHIQCTVLGCGTHWCFYCGKAQDENSIYDHMNTERGGYYGGGEWDTDEEYEE